MNTKNSLIAIVLAIAAILIVGGFIYSRPYDEKPVPAAVTATSTAVADTFDQAISDGTIAFGYPSKEFGLATNTDQILVKSYIPPCSEKFDYCLYYHGSEFAGTNFESSGVRIEKRADLKTQTACLNAMPNGFAGGFVPKISTSTDYVTSSFSPLGDAGAGHYASGALYRLSYKGSCYEFETRIGQTQFANYPAGSIKEFTAALAASAQRELSDIMAGMTLMNGEKVRFPN